MAQKPSIPKGTRDFSPSEMSKRNFIFDSIKSVFRLYGFQPIETPAMENLSSLMGKYGEEGDKLLFKILNSGDFISGISDSDFQEKNNAKITNKISEKGLRYDLTVPFARFVVQYRNDITFPFKRYQVQPVWRADRPQRGRYREFYQCDVDIVGSDSLLNEMELVQIVNEIFGRLKIRSVIKINNRKVLAGIAEVIGEKDRIVDITVAIDKLDKIGIEKVNDELLEKGIPRYAIEKLQPILQLSGSVTDKLFQLEQAIGNSEIGCNGINELRTLFGYIDTLELSCDVELDLTLARGLNYYTGAIFEVKAKDVQIGSICGGGRYDDLTGVFGMPGVSGVGISFGADRIYDVMLQLELFPNETIDSVKLMFTNFGELEETFCLKALRKVREAGINAEIYPDRSKIKKQMTWANNKNVPYVAIVGADELESQTINLKNMITGEQQFVNVQEMIKILSL